MKIALKQLLFVAGSLSAFFLSACTAGTPSAKKMPLRFETFSAEEISVLECDPKKPSLNISVDLRYAADPGNPQASALINREILTAALVASGEETTLKLSPDFARTVENYIAAEVKSYQDAWTEIYNDWGHSNGAENVISIHGNTRAIIENTIIYGIEVGRDMGGAHPLYCKYFLNFDAASGKRLGLNDLFKPGYEKALTELLTRKAMNLENVALKSKLSCEPKPTENFIVEADGILFYYNPYDIAPYSRGPISLKLRYSELAKLLKNAPATKQQTP